MGSALDLRVVAEGIERVGQAVRLRQAGCLVGQGFLYGRSRGRDDPACWHVGQLPRSAAHTRPVRWYLR